MTTVAEHIRAGYEIVTAYGTFAGQYLVLQKGESVVIASIPTNAMSGQPNPSDSNRPKFVKVP